MLLTAGISLISTAFAQSGAWIEQNGLVVIEAENIDLVPDWVTESSDNGFKGSGYIRWDGPDFFGTPGNGVIAIPFKVNAAGNYYVKLRMSHLGAPKGDQWNDAWMKMNDGGTFVKAVHPSTYKDDGFTFHTTLEPRGGVFEPPLYNIPAGENTLYLSGRSYNLRIDRIHIYKQGTPDPENPNSPESPREGGGGGDPGNGGLYTLSISGGSGSGEYPSGTVVSISANPPGTDQAFDRWTGSTQHVADAFSASTAVTMPAANISLSAAFRSTALREPENPQNTISGLTYEYFEGYHEELPDFNALSPSSTGTVPTFDIGIAQQADEFLFRFTGFVDVPSDGTYTFYTASDDGSQLWIGDLLIVDNDSIQSVQERSGVIGLKAGKHAITTTYFERNGDEALTVSWQGPGIPKAAIPATVLSHGGESGGGTPLLGDVSQNGDISAQDAAMVLNHIIGKDTLEGTALAMADVTGNGVVSAFDAALILHHVVQIIDCFPADAACAAAIPDSATD